MNFGRSQRMSTCVCVCMCLPVTKYKSPLRITPPAFTIRPPNNNALASTLKVQMHTPPALQSATEGRCKNPSVSPHFTYRLVSAVVGADARVVDHARPVCSMVKPRVSRWIVTKILYRIFCKIRPRTWSARSCLFYAYMRVRNMYMPIMAVKTRKQCTLYQVSGARTAQLIEFLFVFDTARNRRMKASFIMTAKDRKVSFAIFSFCFHHCPSTETLLYKISITIKS